ncbi:MAG: Unknown protein [uncultured Thiotrichaceae bacterium]|uniref:PIN-like domain-containing protein n=1 Tax=uncultured Thiotrichaceae bacterium TaxID=298394 RepID=A0A6S6U8F2_9GAMM|nr:MAG: Unknown protein [uncultured Thiotrichaceae bacterium]
MMGNETWVLVDLENIGSTLKGISLTSYSKIFIFVGARQNTLSLQSICIDKLVDIKILKIKEVSNNNLDFHIAYYLGKFDALHPKDISLVVISNDKGYDNLIRHIKHNGRHCSRIGKAFIPSQKLNPEAEAIIVKIINTDFSKLPKTEASLKNVIQSRLGGNATKKSIDEIYKMLIKHELIKSRLFATETF